jgi:hypothetical protein
VKTRLRDRKLKPIAVGAKGVRKAWRDPSMGDLFPSNLLGSLLRPLNRRSARRSTTELNFATRRRLLPLAPAAYTGSEPFGAALSPLLGSDGGHRKSAA